MLLQDRNTIIKYQSPMQTSNTIDAAIRNRGTGMRGMLLVTQI